MAFVVPCISIVVCYARIFYIVRKTALRSHESASTLANTNSIQIQSTQSRKSISSNNNKNSSLDGTDVQLLPPKITANAEELLLNEENNQRRTNATRCKGKMTRENLTTSLSLSHSQSHGDLHKNTMKFIDTSVECDFPPTLSALKKFSGDERKLCVSERNSSNVSICRTVEFIDEGNRRNGSCDRDYAVKMSHEMDSAVEESTSSTENNQV